MTEAEVRASKKRPVQARLASSEPSSAPALRSFRDDVQRKKSLRDVMPAGEGGPSMNDASHPMSLERLANVGRFHHNTEVEGETTPPGYEDIVKALKRQPGVENPWAIAWGMRNKGITPKATEVLVRLAEEWDDSSSDCDDEDRDAEGRCPDDPDYDETTRGQYQEGSGNWLMIPRGRGRGTLDDPSGLTWQGPTREAYGLGMANEPGRNTPTTPNDELYAGKNKALDAWKPGDPTLSKTFTNYRYQPDETRQCRQCVHYSDGTCEVLGSGVRPIDGCDAFRASGETAAREAIRVFKKGQKS
jgi:hypothetical protein